MQLAQIWRHPVKPFQGEILESAQVEESGLSFDRAFDIIDDATGKIVTACREPKLLFAAAKIGPDNELFMELPDGSGHREIRVEDSGDNGVDRAVDESLSEWIGRPVHLALALDHASVTAESYRDAVDEASPLREWQLPEGRC